MTTSQETVLPFVHIFGGRRRAPFLRFLWSISGVRPFALLSVGTSFVVSFGLGCAGWLPRALAVLAASAVLGRVPRALVAAAVAAGLAVPRGLVLVGRYFVPLRGMILLTWAFWGFTVRSALVPEKYEHNECKIHSTCYLNMCTYLVSLFSLNIIDATPNAGSDACIVRHNISCNLMRDWHMDGFACNTFHWQHMLL